MRKISRATFFILALALLHLGLALYMNIKILGSVPHIPDSAVYYQQALLLGSGRLFASNFTFTPVEAVTPLGGIVRDGRLHFHYNHFWPALLALPVKFGLQAVLNPLLSALSLILIFLITKRLFDARAASIAAALYCISPITIIMAGDYMMHTATQFCLLSAFYLLLEYLSQEKAWQIALSGFFLSYAFALRQLTAIAVAAPVLLYVLLFYRKAAFKWKSAYFILGFAPVFILFLLDNKLITGSLLLTPHAAFHGLSPSLANVLFGINFEESLLAFIPPLIFHSILPVLFIGLAFIPLIVLRKKEDFLLIAIFISLFASYFFINSHGIHGYGPRFAFEALFVFFVLAARGMLWILDTTGGVTKTACALAFIFLILYNCYGLYTVLPYYKNYNTLDTELVKEMGSHDLTNTIILLPPSAHWQTQGLTAVYFDPTFTKLLVVRELPGNTHLKILEHYPEKAIYRWEDSKLVPYTLEQLKK